MTDLTLEQVEVLQLVEFYEQAIFSVGLFTFVVGFVVGLVAAFVMDWWIER